MDLFHTWERVYNRLMTGVDDNGSLYGDERETVTWTGKRISGVSCQINKLNILYTYIIEERIENTWVPKERIIGIINLMGTGLGKGYRKEFRINDTNFGGYFKEANNYKAYAAIGLHKGG